MCRCWWSLGNHHFIYMLLHSLFVTSTENIKAALTNDAHLFASSVLLQITSVIYQGRRDDDIFSAAK